MVLSAAAEPVGDFLARVADGGVTHISGTPSHWRRALMSPALRQITPAYVRLSGEAADQAILDRLHEQFPAAGLSHAFASTEAGVAFDVRDGQAGFPVAFVEQAGAPAELRVTDGVLQIRSNRTALRYLGSPGRDLADDDGFVTTGDMLERHGDRYRFVGRREGVINVGGQKVYPEEVEAVINQHPDVRMSRVRGRPSPVTGAIVAAEIVLKADTQRPEARLFPIRDEIVNTCRAALASYKVPVTLKMVPSLEIAASGKMARVHA
jgi:acyl-CoA synthetase (AMP-forming)/AMP-acid ligase II